MYSMSGQNQDHPCYTTTNFVHKARSGGGFVLLQKIKPCPHNREKEFTIQDLGHTRGEHSHTMQIIRSMHKQIRWLKEL